MSVPWDRWESPTKIDGQPVNSCAQIVTDAPLVENAVKKNRRSIDSSLCRSARMGNLPDGEGLIGQSALFAGSDNVQNINSIIDSLGKICVNDHR